MADEQLALSPSVPPPPTEADYEAIFTAVTDTMRGRWFLAEYAKRNRHADTDAILAALARVEAAVRAAPPAASVSPAERVRIDLVEMAKAIAHTRAEIASIRPEGDYKGSLSEATEELDSIVNTTEHATSDILAAAEQVQEIAWTLREHGTDTDSCDALDRRAADIYTACSFQDLTGQRTRKVVDVLRFLEDRIKSMIAIWGDAVQGAEAAVDGAVGPHIHDADGAERLDQPHIDEIMPGAPAAEDAPAADAGEPPAAAHAVSGSAPETRPAEATAPEPARAPPEVAETEPVTTERAETEPVAEERAEAEHLEAASEPALPERLEPEHREQELSALQPPAAPAEAAQAAPEHPIPAHAEVEQPEPEPMEPEHTEPGPERFALADREPEPAAAAPSEPPVIEPEFAEMPAAPDDIPTPEELATPPVIVPAVAAVSATVLELSPPDIGPAGEPEPTEASELVPELEPESRPDPVAVLERILAIIHEPLEGAVAPPVAAAALGERKRPALAADETVTPPPVALAGVPAPGAAARPQLGVPAPDYHVIAPSDPVAAPATNVARRPAPPAGIADIPYADYGTPVAMTVTDAIDDILMDVPLAVDPPPARSAAPVVPPIEPAVARPEPMAVMMPLAAAAPAARQNPEPTPPFRAPEPAAKAEPLTRATPIVEAEPTAKAEPAAKAEPIAVAAPVAKAELVATPKPFAEPVIVPAPTPKALVVPEPDAELEWGPEPISPSAPEPTTVEVASPPAEKSADVSALPTRSAPPAAEEPPSPPATPAAEPAAPPTPVRVTPVKPAALATPPEPQPVQRVAAGVARPRHPGLAAIAALSDDEKIALFS